MPLMPGIYEPGAAVISTEGVTADSLDGASSATGTRFLRNRAGRRVLAASVKSTTIGNPARGQFVRGAIINAATNAFGAFELGSLGAVHMDWGPSGIDCSDGVAIDHLGGGAFNCSLVYIDVS